jgi:uncharacterized membrane protein
MDAAGDLLFEAVIMPHRSLTMRGLRKVLIVICALTGATGLMCVSIGAWPVGGFTVLDLLVIAWLFHLNMRDARRQEILLLSPAELRVARTDPHGRRRDVVLPPNWLNVALEERPGRVPALFLMAGGRREEVGACLGAAEKRDLAAALGQALYAWRHPVYDNPQLREEPPMASQHTGATPRALPD